jgi:ATP-dependent Zn protease
MIKEITDKEILNLISDSYDEAFNLINENKNKIGIIANILIENTTLDAEFVNNFLQNN